MKQLITICVMLGLASSVVAYPVEVYTFNVDPIQDDWELDGWVDELGENNFPGDELIDSWEAQWQGHIPCPSEYGGEGAVQVAMQNNSGRTFRELYYVSDPETNLTNVDEWVGQVGSSVTEESFRIDRVGENTPLVYESMPLNPAFEPGEIWEFVIQEYSNTLGVSGDNLQSLGIAGFSAGNVSSSGSIITPEPGTIGLLLLGGLALRRRRRA